MSREWEKDILMTRKQRATDLANDSQQQGKPTQPGLVRLRSRLCHIPLKMENDGLKQGLVERV